MSPFKCNSRRSFYLASISRKHQLEPFRTSKIRRLLGKAALQLGDHRNVSIKLDGGEPKMAERLWAVIKEAALWRRPKRRVDAMRPAIASLGP